MEATQGRRRIERVRHELRRREVDVAEVSALGAELIRVTFTGEALSDFVSLGFDDHVKVFFGAPDGDGARRDYTPRAYDPAKRELTIDFALHGDGVASDWARRAVVGQRLVIGGPRGSMIVPTDYDWHLLAGDVTAVPAIARRLEELPTDARALVLVQLADDAPLRHLRSSPRVTLQRVATASDLLTALRALELPPGDGYAWAGGEAATMAQLRAILVEKGQPRDAMRVAAYWKRGAMAHHEDLAD